jgi:hypothetical protein
LSLGRPSVPGLGKERLEALTDGIFDTVMTVLVLSLSVPVIASGATNAEVAADIETLVPNILAYVLGFLLLAVLWISHDNISRQRQKRVVTSSAETKYREFGIHQKMLEASVGNTWVPSKSFFLGTALQKSTGLRLTCGHKPSGSRS